LQRVDSNVNFNLGKGSPAKGIDSDHFSARWDGFVQVIDDGCHHFSTRTDDGVRLWVNQKLLIDPGSQWP